MKNASQLLAALNEPVFELDLEGKVIAATSAANLLSGRDELASHYALAAIFSAKAALRFAQSFKRIADGKVATATIEVTLAADAAELQERPMEAKLASINGVNGKPVAVAVWLRDLSIEKANEAAANVQGTHLLDLVEHVNDACVVERQDGTVEMLNEAFCKLFDIKAAPQSMVGTSCATLFEDASASTEKRIGPLYFPLDAGGSNNQHDQLEFRLASKESVVQATLAVEGETGIAGRLHLFHLKVARLDAEVDSDKPSTGVVATQMALIEKIARELVVALEGAGSAVLRGEQLDLPSQVLNHFRRVEQAATSAFDSVAGLLDFSRIEGAAITLEASQFSLRESVAVMISSIVTRAEKMHVELRVRIEQDVPDKMIGDGARLILALRNLIDSALLSLPDALTTQGEKPPTQTPTLTLTIAPEYESDAQIHLAFAIELLARGSAAKPKTLSPSAVMQLALARQIVRALADGKGKIETIERKLGVSYTFTAAFPFDASRPPKPRPTFVTLTGLPVLIVSENIEERKQLSDWMKSWRMLPREADNATMALRLLNRMADEDSPMPLVVTTNQLSGQDGFLLAFRIKQHPHLKQTAIIMLATGGKPGDAITCRENGISAYLRQPVVPLQLNEAITAVMGAEDDATATATLITRHSLRELKKASVLIIDRDRDQAMFAAGGLKKRDYRVALASDAAEAFAAMVQEEFDVIVVDPDGAEFEEDATIVTALLNNIGTDRPSPKILLASESPAIDLAGYDGFVLKPFAKESLVNAVIDILPQAENT
jgi:CheY-like chemotaxis protein